MSAKMALTVVGGSVLISTVSLARAGVPCALVTLASMNSDVPVMLLALKV
jgi:hypothetical protein